MLSKNGVLKKIKNPLILIGSFFLLNLSHKIKFNLNKQQNKKPLEEQPNEKISISIGGPIEKKKKSDNLNKKSTKIKKIFSKPVLLDNNLYKQFKNQRLIKTKKFTAPAKLPGIDFSDHLNYWAFDFSALMITDTAFYRNKNYHENTDTIETLDLLRMSKVIESVYNTLITMK